MDDVGESLSILHHARDIDNASNVDAAVTYENPYPRRLTPYIQLFWELLLLHQGSSNRRKQLTHTRSSGTGLSHSLGDVLGRREHAADENSRPRSFHGVEGLGFAETVIVQLNTEVFSKFLNVLRRREPDREDDYVELFFEEFSIFSFIPYF